MKGRVSGLFHCIKTEIIFIYPNFGGWEKLNGPRSANSPGTRQ